jgi:glycerophosphoryl diester phosphodiesterase
LKNRPLEAGGTRISEIEVIAHRGFSARAPENTLAAIRAALDARADAVEFDLHVAADGTPVLIHDASLGRTTNGVGPVRRRTLGQLRALDAGSWFAPAFEGERIPTLAEALEEVRGRATRAYAEVKGYRELEDLDRMVDITRDLGMLERTTFISLDWRTVERIHGRDDATTIGYVVDTVERFPEALDRAIVRGRAIVDLDAEVVLASPSVVDECHREGVPTAVWTVNDEATADRMIHAGIPRLTTDEVETIVAWRDRGRASGQSVAGAAPFPPPSPESGTAGISTGLWLPTPTLLSTSILPPWACTIPCTIVSPSPVPRRPVDSTLQKRSKSASMPRASMPHPVSDTLSRTEPPERTAHIAIRPPGSVNFRAFPTRLPRTCSMRPRSARMGGRSSATDVSRTRPSLAAD